MTQRRHKRDVRTSRGKHMLGEGKPRDKWDLEVGRMSDIRRERHVDGEMGIQNVGRGRRAREGS